MVATPHQCNPGMTNDLTLLRWHDPFTHDTTHSHMTWDLWRYGVATISRLLKIIGLFCKRAQSKRLESAKETCNFQAPAHHSHPISKQNWYHEFSEAASVTWLIHMWRDSPTRDVTDSHVTWLIQKLNNHERCNVVAHRTHTNLHKHVRTHAHTHMKKHRHAAKQRYRDIATDRKKARVKIRETRCARQSSDDTYVLYIYIYT